MRNKYIFFSLLALISIGILYKSADVCQDKTEQLSTVENNVKSPYGSVEDYFQHKKQKRKGGYAKLEAPEMFAQLERAKRTPSDKSSPEYQGNYRVEELEKGRALREAQLARDRTKTTQRSIEDLDFIERGPGNVAGRTRALLVLPNDPEQNTWLAGSASGGIWKTTDKGRTWTDKTADFPSLGTNTLAMSESDPDVIYAGTGEHFTNDIDGVGMFKSNDAGESWSQIVAPGDYDAFENVSRIAVHPDDANVIIATTRNSVWEDSLRAAIYKSVDGGETWDLKRFSTDERYDDIAFNHKNFNTLYVGVRRRGVLKSMDQGESWVDHSRGLNLSGRIEIASSPVDTNYVWGSAQGSESGTGSDLYVSTDAAETWKLAVEDGESIDFLGGQGWYDNALVAHPFVKNIVYVGGVNLFKMKVSDSEQSDVVYDLQDNGAFDFLDFINGARIGGGITEGNLEPEEVVSIEIRFGQGGQKAHRFSVNGRGSGVPAADYAYQDLVDVPFQVWDITNNVQLMVSFRDQQDDGEWTLKERTLSGANPVNDSREYIFPQNVPYADSANTIIAQDGGHEHRQLFLMWPVLKGGETFDPNSTTPTSFTISAEITQRLTATTTVISDAYSDFNGNNGFSSSEFSSNRGHHPDQHSVQPLIIDSANQWFSLLTTNDGGIYLSNVGKDPATSDNAFTYSGFGYNTSQFYGADKMPGEDRYLGGMQDNSTWFTAEGEVGSKDAFYEFAVGGDGFEAIWNNRDPDLMIASIQFNNFQRSLNGGDEWNSANNGYDDQGPFISRLANSRALPDRIFTVGEKGVWFSNDFGGKWEASPISSFRWSFNNSTDIEVSPANLEVVWAGGAMDEFERLFVSTDAGKTFEPTSFYQDVEMGTVSGIGLHPKEDQTAYALFSFARRPKVLKTTDLGKTWEDISGFDGITRISSRGFPDVATNCLLVFPNDPNRIWVGSEIGIIESLDNGDSWHLLDSNLPAVNVFDMKIQDDQIVLATYGRGIWSVQIEGIERSYIFPPSITSVAVAPDGSINFGAELSSNFDSLQFLIDEVSLGLTVQGGGTGSITLALQGAPIEDGRYEFKIIGYNGGVPYKSLPFEADIFKPGEPTASYFNDFSDSELINDFIGSGFSVITAAGFDNPAIHSDHNYNDRGEITYQLKTPIIVSEEQTFKYKDVVIVELGQQFSRFGEQSFFDYVVAEGSKDGINWTPLFDGYDSSSDPSWRAAYNDDQSGNSSLFVEQESNLLNIFEINDIIFIRYRLFADPFENGWGWAIDDVAVELENSTPVFDVSFESLSIYPNPVDDMMFIEIPPDKQFNNVFITDLQGRRLKSLQTEQKSKVEIETASLSEGIYFIEVYNEGSLVVSQKLVIVHN